MRGWTRSRVYQFRVGGHCVDLWLVVVLSARPFPFFLIGPLFLVGVYDLFQTKHSLRRNFPLVGRGQWVMEALRPPMQQYFVESDLTGSPSNRMFRSLIYQRAKKVLDTNPFGTQVDVYRVGGARNTGEGGV